MLEGSRNKNYGVREEIRGSGLVILEALGDIRGLVRFSSHPSCCQHWIDAIFFFLSDEQIPGSVTLHLGQIQGVFRIPSTTHVRAV
jgi:hypothetical protein